MRVVFAPDSFKGSLSAAEVAAELSRGWREADPHAELRTLPLADGGEGTIAAFRAAVPKAVWHSLTVVGPDGAPVTAGWLRLPPTREDPAGIGVVELASTSGIELLDQLIPWQAHTYGFGQAIAAALAAGVSRLILGIGSSASTDGGSGMLRALGAQFLDTAGNDVPLGAAGLRALDRIDTSQLLPPIDTLVITDVTNPLLGAHGAAAVFGPQKGLSSDDVASVDAILTRYADLLIGAPSSGHPGNATVATPGAGAAGGTGFGLLMWGARLVPGAAEIGELLGLDRAIANADLVVTGEGTYDEQSSGGKAPGYVRDRALLSGVPAALVAGRVTPRAELSGFASVQSLAQLAGSSAAAMAKPRETLQQAGKQLALAFGGTSTPRHTI